MSPRWLAFQMLHRRRQESQATSQRLHYPKQGFWRQQIFTGTIFLFSDICPSPVVVVVVVAVVAVVAVAAAAAAAAGGGGGGGGGGVVVVVHRTHHADVWEAQSPSSQPRFK